MKRISFWASVFVLALASVLFAGSEVVSKDISTLTRKQKASICYGRIQIVNAGEDFRVRVVNAGEDLRVRKAIFGNTPGQWQIVDVGGDFRVRFVGAGEDFRVRFVNVGEGVAD